jgi:AraC family transcriptional activator of mtrCDE
MDEREEVFAGITALLRVKPEIQAVCHFGEQWRSDHGPEAVGWAPFHIVVEGECLLEADGRTTLLRKGDVVLLPHGGPHALHAASRAGGDRRPTRVEHRGHLDIPIRTNVSGDPDTELVCGRLLFDQAHHNMVLAALPAVIHLAADQGPDAARACELIRLIREELDGARMGAGLFARELASLLMVLALRAHLEQQHRQDPGLFALIACKRTGRAFTAMLLHPDREWTLDELAAEALTSRATLVRMFKRNTGMAPLAFLSDLRLNLANRSIRASSLPLSHIAEMVGYRSTSAFSRAYLKRFGTLPSDERRVRT